MYKLVSLLLAFFILLLLSASAMATGTIRASKIDHNNGTSLLPAGVTITIDSETPSTDNPYVLAGLAAGAHTVKVQDSYHHTILGGTCTYPEGGSVCTVSGITTVPTCTGLGTNLTCTFNVTVTDGQVTRLVMKWFSHEIYCQDNGWTQVTMTVDGNSRQAFWKGPPASKPWLGTIFWLHGGGGANTRMCYNSGESTVPLLSFAAMAIEHGFGVVVPDALPNTVTDAESRTCGKIWDATVVAGRSTNFDIPFFVELINTTLPAIRPAGSKPHVMVAGHSRGGYMAMRFGTQRDDVVTAFAMVAAGDPYGSRQDCDPATSDHAGVVGLLMDRGTEIEVNDANPACVKAGGVYPNEQTLQTTSPAWRPRAKLLYHDLDVLDRSCKTKVHDILTAASYPIDREYRIVATGAKSVTHHLWKEEYNYPVIEFFRRAATCRTAPSRAACRQ